MASTQESPARIESIDQLAPGEEWVELASAGVHTMELDELAMDERGYAKMGTTYRDGKWRQLFQFNIEIKPFRRDT